MCRNRRTAHAVCLLLKSGSFFSADPETGCRDPRIRWNMPSAQPSPRGSRSLLAEGDTPVPSLVKRNQRRRQGCVGRVCGDNHWRFSELFGRIGMRARFGGGTPFSFRRLFRQAHRSARTGTRSGCSRRLGRGGGVGEPLRGPAESGWTGQQKGSRKWPIDVTWDSRSWSCWWSW